MNYSFKIYADNIIDVDIIPDNFEAINIVPYVTEGQKYIRNKISENIELSGDFFYIYSILEQNKCVQFDFIITRQCDNSELYRGIFTFFNVGLINNDDCRFSFNVITNDLYLKMLNTWKNEYNILTTNQIVNNIDTMTNPQVLCTMQAFPELETFEFDSLFVRQYQNAPPPPSGWSLSQLIDEFSVYQDFTITYIKYRRITTYFPSPPASFSTATWEYQLKYEREILWVPNGTVPDPAIWHFRGFRTNNGQRIDKYSRTLGHPMTDQFTTLGTDSYLYEATIDYNTPPLPIVYFNNCRVFKNVLNFLLRESGLPTHVSDFMYDTPNPLTNDAENKLAHLLIGQKSDFIAPIGSDKATKGMWSLEKALNFLKDFLNIYVYFDNGLIKLENEFYFQNGLSYNTPNYIDITVDDEYLVATDKFTIDYEKYKGREDFKFAEADGTDFIGVPIKYMDCLPDKSLNVERLVSDVTTDISYVYGSGTIGTVSDSGFVLLQTKILVNSPLQYRIENEVGILEPFKTYANGHLSWSKVQDKYWKKGVRLMRNFYMNNVEVNSVNNPNGLSEMVKIKEEITIPYCCSDFNFNSLIRINNGEAGKIVDAKFSLNTEMLTLKLAYNV